MDGQHVKDDIIQNIFLKQTINHLVKNYIKICFF